MNKSAKCSCVAPAHYLFYRPLTFSYQINHHEKLANCSNLEPVFEASSANYGFFFLLFLDDPGSELCPTNPGSRRLLPWFVCHVNTENNLLTQIYL